MAPPHSPHKLSSNQTIIHCAHINIKQKQPIQTTNERRKTRATTADKRHITLTLGLTDTNTERTTATMNTLTHTHTTALTKLLKTHSRFSLLFSSFHCLSSFSFAFSSSSACSMQAVCLCSSRYLYRCMCVTAPLLFDQFRNFHFLFSFPPQRQQQEKYEKNIRFCSTRSQTEEDVPLIFPCPL